MLVPGLRLPPDEGSQKGPWGSIPRSSALAHLIEVLKGASLRYRVATGTRPGRKLGQG